MVAAKYKQTNLQELKKSAKRQRTKDEMVDAIDNLPVILCGSLNYVQMRLATRRDFKASLSIKLYHTSRRDMRV